MTDALSNLIPSCQYFFHVINVRSYCTAGSNEAWKAVFGGGFLTTALADLHVFCQITCHITWRSSGSDPFAPVAAPESMCTTSCRLETSERWQASVGQTSDRRRTSIVQTSDRWRGGVGRRRPVNRRTFFCMLPVSGGLLIERSSHGRQTGVTNHLLISPR